MDESTRQISEIEAMSAIYGDDFQELKDKKGVPKGPLDSLEQSKSVSVARNGHRRACQRARFLFSHLQVR